MKKLLYILCVSLILLNFCACSGSEQESDDGVVYYTARAKTLKSSEHAVVETTVVQTTASQATSTRENTVQTTATSNAAIQAAAVITEESADTANEPVAVTNEKTLNINNSMTVYVTPSGKKYHYIESCPGKNSTPTTLEKAIASGKGPCKKCVD